MPFPGLFPVSTPVSQSGLCLSAAPFAAAHLVGIRGSGMKALAELLNDLGVKVTGSDQRAPDPTTEWMRSRGLHIHQGHHTSNLPADAEALIHSPAVGPENPERTEAAARGIPQFSYTEMLGRLMEQKLGMCIAGTHGKSTTTAMVASILESAERSPSVVIGAEIRGRDASGWAGHGDFFVVESCEYKRNFLNLSPHFAVITGIEADHFDCFRSLDETISAFAAFARRVPDDGIVVIRNDCQASHAACLGIDAEVQTFSLEPGGDWWAADLRTTKQGIRFRIFHRGDYFTEISLQVPGQHNVLNALAAAALCHRAGISPQQIQQGLQEFGGIRRRFEPVGSWRGVTLIDDYAHHPTAIQATLRTARQRFGGRRIWCVFQPHQVSRTLGLMDDFAKSFAEADLLLVAAVYGARETYQNELLEVSCELARKVGLWQTGARVTNSLDQTIRTLEDEAKPGDVLITMGAGDIEQVHYAFTRRLQRNHAQR